jgi:spore coat protein CotH
VGVRLRGAIGSFREIWDKPKFKIEFDWHVDGRDFYGLEELALNNSVADCSYLKEAVAYEVFELAGVDRPRLSFARVTLNGADYGLYQVVESVDENFLADRRVDPNGNLYDGKYIWYGGWSYTLLDFDAAVDDQFKLEEGVDVGHVDIHAVTDAVAAGQYTPQWHALTDPVVDWDQWHAVLAVEELIGHNDGYALNQNNYRVYFDPVDGKAEMLPWDLDNTFLEDVWWGMNWAAPRGKLAAPCWADPTCAGAQADAAAELLNALPTFDYAAFVEDLHVLTYDAAMSDPKLPWCAAYVAVNRQAIVDWLDQRPSDLVAHWDL